MEQTIKDIYETSFDTAYGTYKEADKISPNIILQDVKDYLNSRQDIQVKVKPRTYNSVVSPGSKFEFEIDTMDIEAQGDASNTRYGLVAIDKRYQDC